MAAVGAARLPGESGEEAGMNAVHGIQAVLLGGLTTLFLAQRTISWKTGEHKEVVFERPAED